MAAALKLEIRLLRTSDRQPAQPAIVVERTAPDDGWEITVKSRLDELS